MKFYDEFFEKEVDTEDFRKRFAKFISVPTPTKEEIKTVAKLIAESDRAGIIVSREKQ